MQETLIPKKDHKLQENNFVFQLKMCLKPSEKCFHKSTGVLVIPKSLYKDVKANILHITRKCRDYHKF